MCRKTNHVSFTCVFHMCVLGQGVLLQDIRFLTVKLHLLLHPEYWLGGWLVGQLVS